ncbi:arca-like protein [Colletotrichum plurivorum]|uniref:Arca-like protein n=1 Tax=Colletotrichum plurivorum TaxID=2175906 RepID=A0A8H6MZH3_9PEZI|nr:arca-like protein [Colletotrichum plurivorum]
MGRDPPPSLLLSLRRTPFCPVLRILGVGSPATFFPRHIKCDKGDPCGQCVRKGRPCLRVTKLKFRHITAPIDADGNRGEPQYEFSKTQKWCRVSGKRLRFIDETSDVTSIHNDDFDSEDDILSDEDVPPSPPRPTPRGQNESSRTVATPQFEGWAPSPATQAIENPSQQPPPIDRVHTYPITKLPALHPYQSPGCASHMSVDEPPRAFSPVPRSQISGPIGSISSFGSAGPSDDPSLPEPQRPFGTSSFPLRDHREASLVRYFTEFIVPAFDFGDSRKRFTTLIPSRAALSPLLLNAVLAVSAKSRDAEDDLAFYDKTAEHYYRVALELLKPALVASASEVGDTHVAAAVLLRLYHKIDLSEVISPSDEAPRSIYDFLVSRTAHHPTPGGLSEAALRGWIRLEIFCAVMRQETLDVRLDDLGFDRALSPADDDTWAWRMVLHSMDVVRYCFGAGGRSSVAYDKLAAYAARWMGAVPESFQPVFVRNPPTGEGDVFPEILLLSDAVVVGMQHFHLNRLLLTAHNPNVPRLGKNQKMAARALDKEITNDIKILCGIADSMGRSNPAHIIACMGITLAGDRLKSQPEQEAVCNMFSATADAFCWDTSPILQHLKDAWGWPEAMACGPG